MRSYRRVLALVEIRPESEAVARRAAQLARFYGATLALAAVVDYTPGLECDHVPFKTPGEMREAIARDLRGKLDHLADGIGAAGSEIIVVSGKMAQAVEDIAGSWRPDLVLVGSKAPHGLDRPAANAAKTGERPYDVLIVQNGRTGFAGRLIHALAASL